MSPTHTPYATLRFLELPLKLDASKLFKIFRYSVNGRRSGIMIVVHGKFLLTSYIVAPQEKRQFWQEIFKEEK